MSRWEELTWPVENKNKLFLLKRYQNRVVISVALDDEKKLLQLN